MVSLSEWITNCCERCDCDLLWIQGGFTCPLRSALVFSLVGFNHVSMYPTVRLNTGYTSSSSPPPSLFSHLRAPQWPETVTTERNHMWTRTGAQTQHKAIHCHTESVHLACMTDGVPANCKHSTLLCSINRELHLQIVSVSHCMVYMSDKKGLLMRSVHVVGLRRQEVAEIKGWELSESGGRKKQAGTQFLQHPKVSRVEACCVFVLPELTWIQ